MDTYPAGGHKVVVCSIGTVMVMAMYLCIWCIVSWHAMAVGGTSRSGTSLTLFEVYGPIKARGGASDWGESSRKDVGLG